MTDEVEDDDTPVSRAYRRLVAAENGVEDAVKERDEAFKVFAEESKLNHEKRLTEGKNRV